MYVKYMEYTEHSNKYWGESSISSGVEVYLKQGWSIVSTYTTREQQQKSYNDENGNYINRQVDGQWLITYVLGRTEIADQLYGQ